MDRIFGQPARRRRRPVQSGRCAPVLLQSSHRTLALGLSPSRKLNCIQPHIECYVLFRHHAHFLESAMRGIQNQVLFFRGDHGRNEDAEARFRCRPGIAEAFVVRAGGKLVPAPRQLVHRYFDDGIIRNFDDELQSCARIRMRGMNPQFQHAERLARSTVVHRSSFVVPAPPVVASARGRQPISKLRLRESVDFHTGVCRSDRQAVFDCAKFCVNDLIALYRSQKANWPRSSQCFIGFFEPLDRVTGIFEHADRVHQGTRQSI
jgi:hypothetical protein